MITWSVYDFVKIIKHLDGIFVHVLLKGLHVAKNDQKDKDSLFSEKYARFWSGCPCKTNENSKLGSQCSRQVFVFLKSMKSFYSLCWTTTLALTWQSHKNLSLILASQKCPFLVFTEILESWREFFHLFVLNSQFCSCTEHWKSRKSKTMSVSSNSEKNSRQIKRWQKRVSVSSMKKILVKSKVVKNECQFLRTVKKFSSKGYKSKFF